MAPSGGGIDSSSALGKAAEVLAVSDDGLQLQVRCGVMRSTVELSAVESLDGRKPELPQAPVVQVKGQAGQWFGRGAHGAQHRGCAWHARARSRGLVEDVLRGANGPVWVIHGIGTGSLKRGLRDWLGSLNYIDRVVDAEQGDGGAGCSVIWMR